MLPYFALFTTSYHSLLIYKQYLLLNNEFTLYKGMSQPAAEEMFQDLNSGCECAGKWRPFSQEREEGATAAPSI